MTSKKSQTASIRRVDKKKRTVKNTSYTSPFDKKKKK